MLLIINITIHFFIPGFEEPLSMPAAAFKKYETGGEVVTKLNVLSDFG